MSDYTDIRSYTFSTSVNETIIDAVNHTVTVDLTKGTDLSNLRANFTLSGGASISYNSVAIISGAGGLNYNSPINVLVTPEDGTTTQSWTITVRERVGINLPEDAIEGPNVLCPGVGVISYGVPSTSAITNYNWSYSGAGVTTTNNGSSRVELVWSSSAKAGTQTVELFSNCGSEGSRSVDIVMGDGVFCDSFNCTMQQLQLTNERLANRASIEVFSVLNDINMEANPKDYNLLYLKAG